MPFRCRFTKPDRTLCKNNTLKSPFCYCHIKSQFGLHVKPSNLLANIGLGLFAEKKKRRDNDKVFRIGQKIADFGNTIVQGLPQTPAQQAYAVGFGGRQNRRFIDDTNPNSSVARFANDARGTHHGANAKIAVDNQRNKACLRATRDINTNTEVLTSYGNGYWASVARQGKRPPLPIPKKGGLNPKRPAPKRAAPRAPSPDPYIRPYQNSNALPIREGHPSGRIATSDTVIERVSHRSLYSRRASSRRESSIRVEGSCSSFSL
jgi:hypothetical protein